MFVRTPDRPLGSLTPCKIVLYEKYLTGGGQTRRFVWKIHPTDLGITYGSLYESEPFPCPNTEVTFV